MNNAVFICTCVKKLENANQFIMTKQRWMISRNTLGVEGQKEEITKGHKAIFKVLDIFTILIVVKISWVFVC